MEKYTPLIHTYLRKYQNDPKSRVFAPLAEAYRKAGMTDEAIEIAKEGLSVHPTFIGGRVALARALFDKRLYEEVIRELGPIVREVPDNLIAQRLMAESCLMSGRVAEALDSYKMLLYFAPHDLETGELVQELERQAYEKGRLVLRSDPAAVATAPVDFAVKAAPHAIDQDPKTLRRQWAAKIEKLQSMLLQVERYRLAIRG